MVTGIEKALERCLIRRGAQWRFAALLVALMAVPSASGAESSQEPGDLQEASEHFKIDKTDRIYWGERNVRHQHYPASNENRLDLFQDVVAGLGGGYLGVGTDQNLTLAAWAQSEYIWLMDFDPVIVALNRIHILFLTKAETYSEFKRLWSKRYEAQGRALVKERYFSDPEFPVYRKAWKVGHRPGAVFARLKRLDRLAKKFGLSTFNTNPKDYQYLRSLALKGRIQSIYGDLTRPETMSAIAESARKMGVEFGVVYLSNAEEYTRYPRQLRKNMEALPVSANGVVVRTLTSGAKRLGYPAGEQFAHMPFHYNVQNLPNFQTWMKDTNSLRVLWMVWHHTTLQKGLSQVEKSPEQVDLKKFMKAKKSGSKKGRRGQKS